VNKQLLRSTSEPAAVYRHLDWLEQHLPFPVYRVTAGSLRNEILGAMMGMNRMDARPPFFTKSGGMVNRQCTHDFKLVPIQRKIRELIGLKPRQRGPKLPSVTQWIGISKDEAIRMKPSRYPCIVNRWPLIEMNVTRSDCLKWRRDRGYPMPPKSECTFCPYHDNAQWRHCARAIQRSSQMPSALTKQFGRGYQDRGGRKENNGSCIRSASRFPRWTFRLPKSAANSIYF
jgi:hypothetical protein